MSMCQILCQILAPSISAASLSSGLMPARGPPGKRGRKTNYHTIDLPNFYTDLPEALWPYTVGQGYDATNPHLSLAKGAGAGHHGSHSHLVNEFVRSILDKRQPWINEELSANITAAGICAHESAMRNGEWITVPRF